MKSRWETKTLTLICIIYILSWIILGYGILQKHLALEFLIVPMVAWGGIIITNIFNLFGEIQKERSIKQDNLINEMRLIVAPLKNRREDDNIFTYGMLPRGFPELAVYDYYNFWDGIIQNKYLTTKELSSAIDEYLSHKESFPSAQPTPAYNNAKLKLDEAVDKRYAEIIKERSELE